MSRFGTACGLVIALALSGLTACSLFVPRAENPMPVVVHGDPAQAAELVILLPGIRGTPQDFEKSGFIDAARPQIDSQAWALIAPDAHWGYYKNRSLEARLLEDVFARWPNTPVTLVGISLGGLGSLLLAPKLDERLTQLVLLAPFLGDDAAELPPSGPVEDGTDEALRRAWAYLLNPARTTPIYLGWGMQDSFAPAYQVLREQEPANIRWDTIPGDHRWPAWKQLWQRWLAPAE